MSIRIRFLHISVSKSSLSAGWLNVEGTDTYNSGGIGRINSLKNNLILLT